MRHRWTVRRIVARVAAVALVAGGAVGLLATAAGADSPDVATTVGSAVVNADGSITVTVQGTWAWTTHTSDCNTNRFGVGWQVDWNDANAPGNHVTTLNGDSIDVGVLADGTYNTADNLVHYPAAPPRCGTFADPPGYNTGPWGPLSHTYAPGTDPTTITPCALTYDLHTGDGDALKSGDDIAGGNGHNGDNSAEKNSQTPAGDVCAAITIAPDVSVVKTAPAQVALGQNITYGITAANTGIVPATNVTVTDTLPTNATFVSATPAVGSCDAPSGGHLVCHLGTLAVGASASISVTVTPTATGTVTNTAVVTPDDSTPSDNTSTVHTTVIAPDVSVVKNAPAQVTLGQNITYSITVANTGTVAATSVTVTDTLPTNATFVSATPTVGSCDAPASGQLVCHLGTLAVGASASISVTVTPTATGTVTNTAVVTPNDSTPSDNTSTVQTSVIAPAPAAVVVTPAFTG